MENPSPPVPDRPRRRVRLAMVLVRLGQVACALVALAALGVFFVVRHFEEDLPDVRGLRANYRPAQVTRVLGRDGSLLAELFTERRTVVRFEDIPPHVRLAFLAAEDAAFYEHEGLNYVGMLRAFVVNLRAGRTRQGGSTITQQVVKNILLDPERTYKRKLKEVLLARRLEQDLTKNEILELYLNHIYLGGGRYGVEEAARYYFGKSVRDVSIAEAALMAGLPAGPEHFSPRNDLSRSLTRRSFVLDQMERKGFLDPQRVAQARDEVVRLAPPVEAQSALAPEVVEIARKTLKDVAGEGFSRGGYTVYTTIDPRLQALARKAVRENLQSLDKRTKAQAPFKAPVVPSGKKAPKPKADEKPFEGTPKANEWHKAFVGVVSAAHDDAGTIDVKVGDVEGYLKLADHERYNPKGLPPSAFAEPGSLVRVSFLAPPAPASGDKPAQKAPLRLEAGAESALVAIEPKTRDILALVGSYEGTAGGLDRATQSKRQPGSTFKPVLYSYGLHSRKITPASVFDAQPPPQAARNVNVEDANPSAPLRLREAVAKSVNAVAQRVMLEVGPANVVKWAQQLGVTSKLGADLSLALGSYEVTPLEMAGAYATFAAGGVYEQPRLVTRITGPDGKDLPMPERPAPQRVMDEAEAYLTTSLLSSVIDHGTGAKARELGRPLAGKTGTTNQAKDTWFVGYSTDVVCSVWVGYDEPRPLGGGKEAGATAALPAWIAFMKGAHEKKVATDFPRPAGLVTVRIDPASGLRAYEGQTDAIDELFLAGTEPVTTAEPDAGAPDPAPSPEPSASGSPALPALPQASADAPSPVSPVSPPSPRAAPVVGPAPASPLPQLPPLLGQPLPRERDLQRQMDVDRAVIGAEPAPHVLRFGRRQQQRAAGQLDARARAHPWREQLRAERARDSIGRDQDRPHRHLEPRRPEPQPRPHGARALERHALSPPYPHPVAGEAAEVEPPLARLEARRDHAYLGPPAPATLAPATETIRAEIDPPEVSHGRRPAARTRRLAAERPRRRRQRQREERRRAGRHERSAACGHLRGCRSRAR